MILNLKRDVTHPSAAVAFEVVSPHHIPDGTILQANSDGSVAVYDQKATEFWAVLPPAESIEIALAVLKATKWTGHAPAPAGASEDSRLRGVLESVELMLGFPAEQPEAFELGPLRATVKAAHKLLSAELKKGG